MDATKRMPPWAIGTLTETIGFVYIPLALLMRSGVRRHNDQSCFELWTYEGGVTVQQYEREWPGRAHVDMDETSHVRSKSM